MALIAEIIGELPGSGLDDPKMSDGRIVLEDASGRPIYGFGNFEPSPETSPRVTRSLSPPLGAWRLKYFEAPGSLAASSSGTASLTMGFGLAALVIAVLTLAVFVLRENGREAQEARRRVTFVNQVSHELKTPLTSIRMYAELLEEELHDDDSKAPEYLGVIVSESRRLSRLIGNVLSFAKQQGQRPSPSIIDEEIERVLDYHRPLFQDLGAKLTFSGNSKKTCLVDIDILGQILGNLLSNAEKYGAGSGGEIKVTSSTHGDLTQVIVSDEGPGIPRAVRQKIFKPFYRISGKITEGVSGTGIGLSISRDLARLHGGDLTLEQSPRGALFKLVIKTPKPQGETP
jgi:signal transduction histidine kinase